MKKLLALWHRFIRDFFSGIVAGTVLGVVWFYIIALLYIFFGSGEDEFTFLDSVIFMLIFQSVSIGICCVFMMIFKRRPVHKYDNMLIGDDFAGFSKKSRAFRKGVESYHRGEFRSALEIFTDLDDPQLAMDESERGILSFYRGRCYHILNCFPNAVMCYEKAKGHGFAIAELPIFTARCCAANGETERAAAILTELMDSGKKYSRRARYEIGMIYLRLNDGENALKWFDEAIERRESYAEALGGAAIAHTLLHHIKKGEELYRLALLNNIEDSVDYTRYYKEIQAAVVLETRSSSGSEDSE